MVLKSGHAIVVKRGWDKRNGEKEKREGQRDGHRKRDTDGKRQTERERGTQKEREIPWKETNEKRE